MKKNSLFALLGISAFALLSVGAYADNGGLSGLSVDIQARGGGFGGGGHGGGHGGGGHGGGHGGGGFGGGHGGGGFGGGHGGGGFGGGHGGGGGFGGGHGGGGHGPGHGPGPGHGGNPGWHNPGHGPGPVRPGRPGWRGPSRGSRSPVRFHGGGYSWRHWNHSWRRPVFGWNWTLLRTVTCVAQDSVGYEYPVTETGYIGIGYQSRIAEIEDAAVDRCYEETNGDEGCQLLTCTAGY